MNTAFFFAGLLLLLFSVGYVWENVATLLGLTQVKILMGNILIGAIGILVAFALIKKSAED